MLSQTDRILTRLVAGPMCSFEPLEWSPPIARTAARIRNLRDQGHPVHSETCTLHDHGTRAVQYTLEDV